MKMRYGLEDGSEHTLEEVGRSFTLTRESAFARSKPGSCARCARPLDPASSSHFSRRDARMTAESALAGKSRNAGPVRPVGLSQICLARSRRWLENPPIRILLYQKLKENSACRRLLE